MLTCDRDRGLPLLLGLVDSFVVGRPRRIRTVSPTRQVAANSEEPAACTETMSGCEYQRQRRAPSQNVAGPMDAASLTQHSSAHGGIFCAGPLKS